MAVGSGSQHFRSWHHRPDSIPLTTSFQDRTETPIAAASADPSPSAVRLIPPIRLHHNMAFDSDGPRSLSLRNSFASQRDLALIEPQLYKGSYIDLSRHHTALWLYIELSRADRPPSTPPDRKLEHQGPSATSCESSAPIKSNVYTFPRSPAFLSPYQCHLGR